jgi:hypothetical protein
MGGGLCEASLLDKREYVENKTALPSLKHGAGVDVKGA